MINSVFCLKFNPIFFINATKNAVPASLVKINPMSSIKFFLFKRINLLISSLLAIIGFTNACDSGRGMEYGTPHADFIVKGTVTSEIDKIPVKNMKVVINTDTTRTGSFQFQADSVITDEKGYYQVKISDFPSDHYYKISILDVDGPQNGQFQETDTTVEFKNAAFKGGDGDWYAGMTEKELNVSLKPE